MQKKKLKIGTLYLDLLSIFDPDNFKNQSITTKKFLIVSDVQLVTSLCKYDDVGSSSIY